MMFLFQFLVILAGGEGARLFPISSGYSKSLLPVANRPMIWFQLDQIGQAGFCEVFLIISPEYLTQYNNFIDVYKKHSQYSLSIILIPLDAHGTADALRQAAPRLASTKDIIIISGDIISDMPLSLLAIQHSAHKATLTACLKPCLINSKADAKDGNKPDQFGILPEEMDEVYRQYIALETTSGRVAYMHSVNNVQEFLSFSKYSLQRMPDVTVFTNLTNMHVYICAPTIFKLLEENPQLSSFQNEVVPLITAMQFSPESQSWATTNESQQIASNTSDISSENVLASPVSALSTGSSVSGASTTLSNPPSSSISNATAPTQTVHAGLATPSVQASHSKPLVNRLTNAVRVQAFVVPAKYFIQRCNTLNAFRRLTAMFLPDCPALAGFFPGGIPPIASTGAGAETVVPGKATNTCFGSDVRLEKCTIQNSSIGNHCRVGIGARLTNVIMLDNASVEDGATLQNTIVGFESRVDKKAVVKGCAIGRGVHILENDRRVNENIIDNTSQDDEDVDDEDVDDEDEDDVEYDVLVEEAE